MTDYMNENKLSDLLYEIYEQDLPALEHEKNIEDILSIFKQWALEMVGEDEKRTGLEAGRLAQEDIKIARNNLKQEIRERILESINK